MALPCVGAWGLCAILSALGSDAALSPVRAGDSRAPFVLAQASASTNRDGAEPGFFRRVIDHFLVEDGDAGSDRVNIAGRGSEAGPMSMPLIDASVRQSMVAGTRPLHLSWIGGDPPYKVRITGPSGDVDAAWQPSGKRAAVATISLAEGPYEVQLTDSGGQSVLGGFDVVGQAPAVDEQSVETLTDDQRRVVLAARLSMIDDGAWQLESYEQLAAMPGSPAAAVTARRLAAGRSIADLGAIDTQ